MVTAQLPRRVSGALNLAVGFNPRYRRIFSASRQRRLNSAVARATWEYSPTVPVGWNPSLSAHVQAFRNPTTGRWWMVQSWPTGHIRILRNPTTGRWWDSANLPSPR